MSRPTTMWLILLVLSILAWETYLVISVLFCEHIWPEKHTLVGLQAVARHPLLKPLIPTWRSSIASLSVTLKNTRISSTMWERWSTAWTGKRYLHPPLQFRFFLHTWCNFHFTLLVHVQATLMLLLHQSWMFFLFHLWRILIMCFTAVWLR